MRPWLSVLDALLLQLGAVGLIGSTVAPWPHKKIYFIGFLICALFLSVSMRLALRLPRSDDENG